MEASIEVHEDFLNVLRKASWKHTGLHGFIVGRRCDDGVIEAVFSTYCGSVEVTSVLETASQTHQVLPGGFEICGVILVLDAQNGSVNVQTAVQKYVPNQLMWSWCEDPLGRGPLRTRFQYDLHTVIVENYEGRPLVICRIQSGSGQINTGNFTLLGADSEVCQCEVTVTQGDVLSSSVVFKLHAQVPITVCVDSITKDWEQSIISEINRVCRSLASQACIYSVRDTGVLLSSDDVKGVSGDQSCDILYQHVRTEEGHVTRSKKKAKVQGPLGLDLFLLVSGDTMSNDVPCCSPVVHHSIGDYTSAKVTLPLNVLSVVKSDEKIENLHTIFTTAITNQLDSMRDCLCQFKQNEKLHTPEAFHFRPGGDQSFVTVVYPKSVPDEDLESQRRDIHQLLMKPLDRPLFRRANSYIFPGETAPGGYLINPHTHMSTSGTVGVQFLVSGTYSYHHYMQDRFDDNQWGCAYRSLQTLVSWFRFQGYTNEPIPAHREIQQALVDIGDKQKSFVGSRKWIGSLEVGYCLDQLIGVTCKIMNVSSGADLANKGRELASHFTHQGTPIMIGGGVLAHTILGVDFDEVTGNIRFLILDPHYTGSEDLKIILDKGWCGWKGPDFWDVNAHYNLCMPQRPNVI